MQKTITQHPVAALILACFVILATIYSLVTPVFEAPDEVAHFPVIQYIKTEGKLPVQEPGVETLWLQEGNQPPLYYLLSAGLISWIDTSDMLEIRRPNPHYRIGSLMFADNKNLIIHTDAEAFPWRGTVLAIHLIRFFGVLLASGSVLFTYLLARTVWPERQSIAVLTMALVAFNPMFLFVAGSINNDNLAILLTTSIFYLLMRVLRDGLTPNRSVALAILTALGTLTKISAVTFVPMVGLVLLIYGWRTREWRKMFIAGGMIAIAWLVIAGWWYARNLRLYHDFLGIHSMAESGAPAREIDLITLTQEWPGFWVSYWAMFGALNIPVHPLQNLFYAAIGWFSLIGLIGWLIQRIRERAWHELLLVGLIALQVLVVFAGLVRWTLLNYASQGRLMFAAIALISAMFALGLLGILPERRARWLAVLDSAALLVSAAIIPFVYIAPSYRPPESGEIITSDAHYDFTPPGGSQPTMRLLGYQVDADSINPGDTVYLSVSWEALGPMERDYSVFVHLQDGVGAIIGQTDTLPGLGTIATSDLTAGRRWTDTYTLRLSESAYTPETVSINVGLYDASTCPACQRLAVDGGDTVTLGTLDLQAQASEDDIPNPIDFNFNNEMGLVGFEIAPRSVAPGEDIHVTLYWRALSEMSTDYTISIQMLGPEFRVLGQRDAFPLDGALPTSSWEAGEIIKDEHIVTIASDAPLLVADVQIVIYHQPEPGVFERLHLIADDGRTVDDWLILSQIRVGE